MYHNDFETINKKNKKIPCIIILNGETKSLAPGTSVLNFHFVMCVGKYRDVELSLLLLFSL